MARVKTAGAGAVSYGKKETLLSYMKRHKWMYLLMLPGIIYFVIFKYVPSLGVKAYTPYVWQCPRDVLQKDENIITIAVTNTLANMLDGTYFDYDSQKLVNIEP